MAQDSNRYKGHNKNKSNDRHEGRPNRRPSLKKNSRFKKDDSSNSGDFSFKKFGIQKKQSAKRTRIPAVHEESKPETNEIRLNKYIAHSGICSRREADTLISKGEVEVNGKVVTELGVKVMKTDEVKVTGQVISHEQKVYILLNKPKDFITTVDDPQGRRTVMELVSNACKERIYPVGRLDRMTTGLLLFTNDGAMTKKLTHPSNEISKLYHVSLDKPMSSIDFDKLKKGVKLEDGFIKPDEVSYAEGAIKSEIGIKLHSGKNRIVRRMFEHLGYDVERLDRVLFAGLTKKNLPRGRFRKLTQQEIAQLHML